MIVHRVTTCFISNHFVDPEASEKMSNQYEIENILEKRVRYRKHQYLVKWLGYSSAENSWVSENKLDADDLLCQFETNRTEKVLGVAKENNDLCYLIQIKNSKNVEEVSATLAAKTIPMHVVNFLETKLEWVMLGLVERALSEIPQECTHTSGAPEKIHYATKNNAEVLYWCEWAEQRFQFVPSSKVKACFPAVAIKFLQDRLEWN